MYLAIETTGLFVRSAHLGTKSKTTSAWRMGMPTVADARPEREDGAADTSTQTTPVNPQITAVVAVGAARVAFLGTAI